MGRDGASYQDTIARLEADIAKMKVTIPEVQGLLETFPRHVWKVESWQSIKLLFSHLGGCLAF